MLPEPEWLRLPERERFPEPERAGGVVEGGNPEAEEVAPVSPLDGEVLDLALGFVLGNMSSDNTIRMDLR